MSLAFNPFFIGVTFPLNIFQEFYEIMMIDVVKIVSGFCFFAINFFYGTLASVTFALNAELFPPDISGFCASITLTSRC